jgi:membrane associated rhomboid family serine protease
MPKVSSGEHASKNTLTLALSPDSSLEHRQKIIFSYQAALRERKEERLASLPWATWMITLLTCGIWCVTAYQVALNAGARTLQEVLANIFAASQNVNVLLAFGAKYGPAILAGQYWRLITPIFLHATIWHIGLNMLNFVILGTFFERIFGHLRFVLIYLLAGVSSMLASFAFAPQLVSVGASGAIFGLVGAYGAFVLVHRQALRNHGIIALGWLILVIGINIGLGFVISGTDNYAHVGGLLSGCLLGWFFTPFYRVNPAMRTHDGLPMLVDVHSLKRRWPLILLFIVLIILSTIIALHFVGG